MTPGNSGGGLTSQQLQQWYAQIAPGASASQWTVPEPPKPKPVMAAPNITERWASWMALGTSVAAWLIVFVSIAVWQVDFSSAALVAFTAGTAAGMWFVRRHELNIRKRQYMADVLASQ